MVSYEWLGLQVARVVIFGVLAPLIVVGVVLCLPGIIFDKG